MPTGTVKFQRILMCVMTIRIMPHLQVHVMKKRTCPAEMLALLQWLGAHLVERQETS